LTVRYTGNNLISRRPIQKPRKFQPNSLPASLTYPVLSPVSRGYPGLLGRLSTCYWAVRRGHNASRLAWLNRTPIAVTSGRINQNYAH